MSSIGWPAAIVIATLIIGIVGIIGTRMAAKASIDAEEAKGKYGEQYRMLADDYEQLAKETRESMAAMQADLAQMRSAVESMEAMMREVG